MPSDYAAIRLENRVEYGNVGRWGRDVLANRYDSKAHFIYEIIQNAEDALKRRGDWKGSRELRFELTPTALRVSHSGVPFTLKDVKGVCGVGETTKGLTDIGRFGIGFKSVYTITDRPEVHSGDEDFAIEDFVFPVSVPTTGRKSEATEFILPFRPAEIASRTSAAEGLSQMGPRTLLFLRQIEEIAWAVHEGESGLYIRGKSEHGLHGSRRVSLIGEREGKSVVDETWLVFSREAKTDAGSLAGYIEIAFLLHQDKASGSWSIQPVDNSPLTVFFPTVVTTHLGFLVQGPYRTTPSRDNVPPQEPWNIRLVAETASLLVESLRVLRDDNLLDVAALQSLPLERSKYPVGSMFVPLFEAVRTVLSSEPLLPRFGGGWVAAKSALLARTQDLRELFQPKQLAVLFGSQEDVHWLSGEITRDTASTLRQYIRSELSVVEVTPEQILPKLDKKFLEAQSDGWILSLYEFLSSQTALIRQGRFNGIPLIRLEDGTHVVSEVGGKPQAFLPSAIKTDFPTVRRSVCSVAKAIELLRAMGLTEPNPVDDVVRNVLPKYLQRPISVTNEQYDADIRRVWSALGTDSKIQRDKLVVAAKATSFIRAKKPSDNTTWFVSPDRVYVSTERLMQLLAGVADVMLVDESYACLKGDDARERLESCGAHRTLRPIKVHTTFSWEEQREMRRKAGCEDITRVEGVEDSTLWGLKELLALLPRLDPDARKARARLLWEALKDVEQRRGEGSFSGTYTWTYRQSRSTPFDAEFVRLLNATPWIPDADGNLERPEFIVFDSLGWEPNPFLASKIRFKPPIIDSLARESGIEPKTLEILKKHGLTGAAELMAALGLQAKTEPAPVPGSSDGPGVSATDTPGTVEDALKDLLGVAPPPTPPIPDPTANDPRGDGGGNSGGDGQDDGGGGAGARGGNTGQGGGGGSHDGSRPRTPGSSGGRPFISYLGAHPTDEEPDPDGLAHEARMALEAKAIEFILANEKSLRPTETGNKGFDLFEPGADGQPVRWVEVKAMTGAFKNRAVGISTEQFKYAQKHGGAFWLYVVEYAADPGTTRLIRIQDPAGKARTFTFDHGWLNVASEGDADTLTP